MAIGACDDCGNAYNECECHKISYEEAKAATAFAARALYGPGSCGPECTCGGAGPTDWEIENPEEKKYTWSDVRERYERLKASDDRPEVNVRRDENSDQEDQNMSSETTYTITPSTPVDVKLRIASKLIREVRATLGLSASESLDKAIAKFEKQR
jgi:hypothetical protein